MSIILWIVLGAVAGWIAGMIMHSKHSLIEDIVLGIVGAVVGGLLMSFIGESGITGFNLYSMVVAIGGAILLIILGRLIH